MPQRTVDLKIGEMFIGFGLFLLLVMVSIIAPELAHQHLNYSSFPFDVRVISRYGVLSVAFGVLFKRVFGGVM